MSLKIFLNQSTKFNYINLVYEREGV